MKKTFKYMGEETCATDSLCAVACPVKVDNGKLTKELRHSNHTEGQENKASWIARRWSGAVWAMRAAWNTSYVIRRTVGKKVMKPLAQGARWISCGLIPKWNPSFPKGNRKISKAILEGKRPAVENSKGKVVYFLECTGMVTSISEYDMGYIISLQTPDSIGADFTVNNTIHHNCVILYHTRSRFQNGDVISGQMYLDNKYSAAYCNFHHDTGLPEGVCYSLD